MNVKVEELENSEVKLEITVSAEKFEEGMNKAFFKNAKYFSIFPIGEATISIRNAAYELNNVTINENDTYTVSNAPLKNDIEPTIYVHSGMVYLFTIK